MESVNHCLICGSTFQQRSAKKADSGVDISSCSSEGSRDYVDILCKLLSLSTNCSSRLKTGAATPSEAGVGFFCPECTTNLCTITQVFEEIRKLQEQVEGSKTVVKSQIKQSYHRQRRPMARSTSSEPSVVDSFRKLIVEDIGTGICSQNPATSTSTGFSFDGAIGDIDGDHEDIDNDHDHSYDPLADSNHGPFNESDQLQLNQSSQSTNITPKLVDKECIVDLSSVKVEVIDDDMGIENLPSPPPRPRRRGRPPGRKKKTDREGGIKLTRKRTSLIVEDYDYAPAQVSPSQSDTLVKAKRRRKSRVKDERNFYCTECPATFIQKSALKIHLVKNHQATEYSEVCSNCGKRFLTKSGLDTHTRAQGGTCEKPPLPPNVTVLRAIGPYQFQCDICGLKRMSRTKLNNHMVTHTKMKQYICHICGKDWPTSQSLTKHKLSRHPETVPEAEHPYRCTYEGCGKTFGCNTAVRNHTKAAHLNQLDFVCETCGYKTFTKTLLRIHIEIQHLGVRKYQCNMCGISLKRNGLAKHILSKHTAPEDRPHKCKQCGKTFVTSYSLSQHEILHTGEKPFECQLCGKWFATNNYLTIHMKTHRKKITSLVQVSIEEIPESEPETTETAETDPLTATATPSLPGPEDPDAEYKAIIATIS